MRKMRLKNYTKSKKLICDWTDKKKFLVHYRMLKFCLTHGMIVDKIHETDSSKQSKCLEKHISFNTHKRNNAKNDFEKAFYKLLNNLIYGKTLEIVRNHLRLELFQKKEIKKQNNNLS